MVEKLTLYEVIGLLLGFVGYQKALLGCDLLCWAMLC